MFFNTPLFPKQRLRGGVLTFDVHKLVDHAGFPVAGRLVLGCGWQIRSPVAMAVAGSFSRRSPAVAVAEALWCRCGASWLWLECGFLYSLGSCRACLHNASRDCLHDMHRCMCASLCLHGCLHASLHGCQMKYIMYCWQPCQRNLSVSTRQS